MIRPLLRRQCYLLTVCLSLFCLLAAPGVHAAEPAATVYVVLWFDTEDYLLPASDDAALHIADFLTREKVPATFKVVGEKARTLERRRRSDVIDALKRHEIGYHSNWHSVPPSPAQYLAVLGWDEGVAEFDRRERPGFEDVKRIFGQTPTCYGQPGSSWAPQAYGALNQWGVKVYLDGGRHLQVDQKPHYYCGLLTLYQLAFVLRARLDSPRELEAAQDKFAAARKQLLAEGGGIVSIYYHPCEFVHKEFWDGVNFRDGANPPRDQWKLPAAKSEDDVRQAYRIFESYVRFIKRFDDVRFITASQAARLYADKAQARRWKPDELRRIAAAVAASVSFQKDGDCALSASETFGLLNQYVVTAGAGKPVETVALADLLYGPSRAAPALTEPVTVTGEQFLRAAGDVAGYLSTHRRIPSTVWIGSIGVPPEAYLQALARVATDLADGKRVAEQVEIRPAKLAAAAYVSADVPELWRWPIFPRGFHAPALMELAQRQAWTIKPALLDSTALPRN